MKGAALLALIVLGLLVGTNTRAIHENFIDFWLHTDGTLTRIRIVGVAIVGALLSSDAWNGVPFAAGEVRNPRRNIPVALALGVAIVSALYISCNLPYLFVLPLHVIQSAPEDRIATAAASAIFGPIAVRADRRRNHEFDVRQRKWNDFGGSASLLCNGSRRPTCVQSCRTASTTAYAKLFPHASVPLGLES